jgi:hypothetical protein
MEDCAAAKKRRDNRRRGQQSSRPRTQLVERPLLSPNLVHRQFVREPLDTVLVHAESVRRVWDG